MKFSVGDRVILKEGDIVAEVITIINSRIIEVLTEQGHEITINTKEIAAPESKKGQAIPDKPEKQLKEEKIFPVVQKEIASGFHLSFQPVYDAADKELSNIKIYFLNKTKIAIILEFSFSKEHDIKPDQQKLIVRAAENAELISIPFNQINGKTKIIYQINPLEGTINWAEGSSFRFSGSINMTPKKLFNYLSKMEAEKSSSFEITLTKPQDLPILPETKPKEIFKNKPQEISTSTKPSKKKRPQSLTEIDLHTESLNIPADKLDNFGILTRQLQALEKAIDRAVLRGQTSLIIIHGVGQGKLKEEVHTLLKGHPQVTFFQYSWRPKYGWGATEAFFK